MVFSAEDPEHPTFRSNASYNRSFQTGLVFSTPPLISVSGVLNSFFCFSGYLLPEQ